MRSERIAIALTLLMSAAAAAPPPNADPNPCDRSLIKRSTGTSPRGETREIREQARPGTYVGSFRAEYRVPAALATAVSTGEIRITVERNGQVEGTVTINTTAATPYGGSGGTARSQLSGTAGEGTFIRGSSGYSNLSVDRVGCSDRISGAVIPGEKWAAMQGAGATAITGSWSVRRIDGDNPDDPEEREIARIRARAEQRTMELLGEARAVRDPLAPGVFPTPAEERAQREAVKRGETPRPLNDLFSRLGREGRDLAEADDCLGEEIIEAMRELARRRLEARLKEAARQSRSEPRQPFTKEFLDATANDAARAEAMGVEPPQCVDAGYEAWDAIAQRRFEDGIEKARTFSEATQLLRDAEAKTASFEESTANWERFEQAVRPRVVAATKGNPDGMAFVAVQAQVQYRETSGRVAADQERVARENIAAARDRLARARAAAAAPPSTNDPEDAAEEARLRAEEVRRAEESLRIAEQGGRDLRVEAEKLRRVFGW